MTAAVAEDLAQIPMSPYLAASLQRAAQYAEAQAHREVTLEHVLLALAEDPEASVILRSSNIDIAQLQSDVSSYLGNLSTAEEPVDGQRVVTSAELQRILEAAAEAAKQGRRREINGAILLAAIVGDGGSTAAHILRSQGLTFEASIAALRAAARQPQASDQTPQDQDRPDDGADMYAVSGSVHDNPDSDRANTEQDGSADDALAAARARVAGRHLPQTAPQSSFELQSRPAPPEADEAAPAESHANPDAALQDDAVPDSPAAVSPLSERPAEPAPHWLPPQSASRPEPHAPPRLQRVPPPLPPDAGLRPPPARSTGVQPTPSGSTQGPGTSSAASPPPMPSQPQGPAPSSVQRVQPSPAHVPPWVGEQGYGRPYPQSRNGSGAYASGQVRGAAARPRSTQINVETGQLAENIPRRMTTGVSRLVEVRIARANVKALAQGLQGGGGAYQHDLMITKAMSVKLRAPDGGFWVEAASPETQWIENVLGVMTDDFASWRWTVTPKASGRRKLQLVVSARTVGADGLAAETALPDQLFEVRVGVNYARNAKRIAGWLTAAIAGGVLARFGEGMFDAAKMVVGKVAGL